MLLLIPMLHGVCDSIDFVFTHDSIDNIEMGGGGGGIEKLNCGT